jgi:hypothetical protein
MRTLARTLGKFDKATAGNLFALRRAFSGDVAYELNIDREAVCTQVQAGTTTQRVPDPNHPAVPTVEVEVPTYEWQCEPLLLARRDHEASFPLADG